MKKLFKRPFAFAITYGILLISFTAYMFLDIFVIPHEIQVVGSNSSSSTTSSSSSSGSASSSSSSTTSTGSSSASSTTSSSSKSTTSSGSSSKTTTSSSSKTKSSGTYTSKSYTDDNISITITTKRVNGTSVYIADITVSSIDYLKTALAKSAFGTNVTDTTSNISEDNDAILSINGDFYGYDNYGIVIRNGVLYRNTARQKVSGYTNEDLVIYNDGTFGIVDENSVDGNDLVNDGALQVFSFGPALINNGKISVTESEEINGQSMLSNPRTAIGIISPLHYVFVVSDGRTSASAGLSLYELASVMSDLGCTTAYNLDGGGSTTMWFNGKVVNQPTTNGNTIEERKVSDIVYI